MSQHYVSQLQVPHASPASADAPVHFTRAHVSPSGRIRWRADNLPTGTMLYTPAADTWMPETLRRVIRDVEALLPAHDAGDAIAKLTFNRGRKRSNNDSLVVVVEANNIQAYVPVMRGRFNEAFIAFVRDLCGRPLRVATLAVDPLPPRPRVPERTSRTLHHLTGVDLYELMKDTVSEAFADAIDTTMREEIRRRLDAERAGGLQ